MSINPFLGSSPCQGEFGCIFSSQYNTTQFMRIVFYYVCLRFASSTSPWLLRSSSSGRCISTSSSLVDTLPLLFLLQRMLCCRRWLLRADALTSSLCLGGCFAVVIFMFGWIFCHNCGSETFSILDEVVSFWQVQESGCFQVCGFECDSSVLLRVVWWLFVHVAMFFGVSLSLVLCALVLVNLYLASSRLCLYTFFLMKNVLRNDH